MDREGTYNPRVFKLNFVNKKILTKEYTCPFLFALAEVD